jgi:WhiB family transcriptional regulator, redox-sensing transcriptional regulator
VGSSSPGTEEPRRQKRAGQRPGSGWDLTEVIPARPAWHAHAACRGLGPVTFFPRTDDRRLASDRRYRFGLNYCRICPVVAECQAAGASEVFGLWGGLTPTERASKRAKAG